MITIKMTRTLAAGLLENIRQTLAESGDTTAAHKIARIEAHLENAGLSPLAKCTGAAHSNPHIDNCMSCAPRWGIVGPRVRIT